MGLRVVFVLSLGAAAFLTAFHLTSTLTRVYSGESQNPNVRHHIRSRDHSVPPQVAGGERLAIPLVCRDLHIPFSLRNVRLPRMIKMYLSQSRTSLIPDCQHAKRRLLVP